MTPNPLDHTPIDPANPDRLALVPPVERWQCCHCGGTGLDSYGDTCPHCHGFGLC